MFVPRETIDNRIALVVGPLFVFEDSLQQDPNNSIVVTGGGTTLSTPSGRAATSGLEL